MLGILTVLITLIVAYAYLREGLFTAFVMFVNVLLAGLVAFNFFEPLANQLESGLKDSFLAGFEDAICLVGLFCATLGALRWITNSLAPSEVEFPAMVLRGGSVLFGALTGYLVSGFLVCVLQTLPFSQHFMSFHAEIDKADPSYIFRKVLPADRVWLGLMHRAGLGVLSPGLDDKGQPITFDRNGSFELRYERYRRFGENGETQPYDEMVSPTDAVKK